MTRRRRHGRVPAAAPEIREFVPPGHFYSVIPSPDDVQRAADTDRAPKALPGIDLRRAEQRQLLDVLAAHYPDLPWTDTPADGLLYGYDNPHYSYADAITLATMIRHRRPRRIVEIGSGDSSCAMVDVNRRFFDSRIDLTFIEPHTQYLTGVLAEAAKTGRVIERPLQEVEAEIFDSPIDSGMSSTFCARS